MNAATVNGPRSWIAALIFLDGDEDFTIAAPEQDLRDVPGGKLLLVSPAGPPATSDNLGASLRVTGNDGIVIDISDE